MYNNLHNLLVNWHDLAMNAEFEACHIFAATVLISLVLTALMNFKHASICLLK